MGEAVVFIQDGSEDDKYAETKYPKDERFSVPREATTAEERKGDTEHGDVRADVESSICDEVICGSVALTVGCRKGPVVVKRTAPYSEIEYLHHHEAYPHVDGEDLDGKVMGQLITGRVSLASRRPKGWISAPYVRRLYRTSRQALTSQMVQHCICSTTSTILDPYIRSARSCGVNRLTFSPGARRFEDV